MTTAADTPQRDQPSAGPGSAPVRSSEAPAVPSPTSGSPGLTWFRLHAGTTVIDFPLHASPGARTWVATIWPDARAPSGWVRQPWQAGAAGRGFVPVAVELGDVVQFGVEHAATASTGQLGRPGMAYWYGYLHAVRTDSIVLHGPHPGPHEAYAAAQHALLAQIHHRPAEHTGRSAASTAQLGDTHESAPVTPAQPPATVNVAFHGRQATVGDPVHGWLVVETNACSPRCPTRPRNWLGSWPPTCPA